MSLAPCSSPSGPARAVSVCPQRGVRGSPLNGKTRGLGAGSGDSVSSSMSSPAAGGRDGLQVRCLVSTQENGQGWVGEVGHSGDTHERGGDNAIKQCTLGYLAFDATQLAESSARSRC